jgi:hypothetical protein
LKKIQRSFNLPQGRHKFYQPQTAWEAAEGRAANISYNEVCASELSIKLGNNFELAYGCFRRVLKVSANAIPFV